jgi:hypothetical protein
MSSDNEEDDVHAFVEEEVTTPALEELLMMQDENYPTKRRRVDALIQYQAIFAVCDDGHSTAINEAIDEQFYNYPQQAAAATDESSSGDDDDSDDSFTATRGGRAKATRGGRSGGSKTKTRGGDDDSDDMINATRGGRAKVTRGGGGSKTKTTTKVTTRTGGGESNAKLELDNDMVSKCVDMKDDDLVAECVDLQVKLLLRLQTENKINRKDLRMLNAFMFVLRERNS